MSCTGRKHISNNSSRLRNVGLTIGVKDDKGNEEFIEDSSCMNNCSKDSKQCSKECNSRKHTKGDDHGSRSHRSYDKRTHEKPKKKSVSTVTVHDRRTQGVKKIAKLCKSSCSIQPHDTAGSVRKIKKQFVRHTEPDIPAEVIVEKVYSTHTVPVINESSQYREQNYKPRYAVPEMYSTLASCAALSKKMNPKKCQKVIEPSTLKLIEKKASTKLNFSPEDKIFKDLIDLNISDALLKESTRRPSFHRKHPKDDVPDLSNFFQPTFLGEYTMCNDVTCHLGGKKKYYNGFAMRKRASAWEILQNR